MEKKHGTPIAFLKWVAEFQDENGNYIELTGDRWHFSDKDDTDNVTEDQLWELYKLHYPDVEDQLATANETIKVLEYDNNRLNGQVEGLTSAVEELKRWKAEAMILLSNIDHYADKHPEIKLGIGKVEFTIERAKKYDESAAGRESDRNEFAEWCRVQPNYGFVRGMGWMCSITHEYFTTDFMYELFKQQKDK